MEITTSPVLDWAPSQSMEKLGNFLYQVPATAKTSEAEIGLDWKEA